jgi:two-component system, LuxR family, sensor kinase FixL
MHLLIEGILEYSRIGRSKEINEDINLDELISEVTDLISPPANIRIKAGRKLPVIRYDKTRAVQVFQNLIGNAVKFNDKANGEVTIDYSEEGNFWKFWIKDNGKGIDNKYFGKIFEIFQTLQPRDQFESTGIGLTIVRKIIETAGGRIWLESDPGKGSCFYFTIPRFIPV